MNSGTQSGAGNVAGVTPGSSPTQVEFSTEALLHWASFTFPIEEDDRGSAAAALALHVYEKLTGESGETAQCAERGQFGYTRTLRMSSGGVIMFHPEHPEMKLYVSIPGESLPLLPFDGPRALIGWVFGLGGTFTRLDPAVDTDRVHISTVHEAIKRGDLVSLAKESHRKYEAGYTTPDFIIKIGSRASSRYCRIYDKAAEQKCDDGRVWTRLEIELKGKLAQVAALHIFQGGDIKDLVFSSIDFRDRSVDENSARCPRLDWWQSWIGACEKISFVIAKTLAQTIEQAYNWYERQVAPTAAFLNTYMGPDSDWFDRSCEANMKRIPEHRWRLLDAEGSWHEKPLPKRFVERVGLGALSDPGFGVSSLVAV